MKVRILPGTTMEFDYSDYNRTKEMLTSMFMAGGLALSQVSYLTGLAPHMIQNWVKRGFITPPVMKKYSKAQFCRIATINFLKDSLQLEKIVSLISHINGHLDDDSDNLIDDSLLYLLFTKVLSEVEDDELLYLTGLEEALTHALSEYTESVPEHKKILYDVLKVMVVAYASAKLKKSAEYMLENLKGEF